MKLINDMLDFSSEKIDTESLTKKESLYEASISSNITKFQLPDKDVFCSLIVSLCEILGKDTFEYIFKVIDSRSGNLNITPDISYALKKENINLKLAEEIYNKINDCQFDEIEPHELIRIEINIKKPLEFQQIQRVYFFKQFIDYLSSLSLKYLFLNFFPKLFVAEDRTQIFLIDSNIPQFYSRNMYFVHNINNVNNLNDHNISEDLILSNYNLNCHFISSALNITPYYFLLIRKSEYDVVNILFDKLLGILSVVFLSNYSELVEENKFSIHISGYKLINKPIDYTSDITYSNVFFRIFEWVYDDKKVCDKIELARNIITIDYHNGFEDINDNTVASIRSNYSIYLKGNVEKYIDLKAKITDNIINLSMKSKEAITTFSTNFRNAFVGNVSFVFAVLIINIANNGNIQTDESIFNRDLTILYTMVMSISFIHLIASRISTYKDLSHYDSTFNELKESYSDLMVKEDLDSTFNNKILLNDKKYILENVTVYSIAWGLSILIGLITLYTLSSYFGDFIDSGYYNIKEAIITIYD